MSPFFLGSLRIRFKIRLSSRASSSRFRHNGSRRRPLCEQAMEWLMSRSRAAARVASPQALAASNQPSTRLRLPSDDIEVAQFLRSPHRSDTCMDRRKCASPVVQPHLPISNTPDAI